MGSKHRSKFMQFRATDGEALIIESDAEAAGMNSSDWMRFRLLGARAEPSGPELARRKRIKKAAQFVADLTPPAPRASAPLPEVDAPLPPEPRPPVSVPPAMTPSGAALRERLERTEPVKPAPAGWFSPRPKPSE